MGIENIKVEIVISWGKNMRVYVVVKWSELLDCDL